MPRTIVSIVFMLGLLTMPSTAIATSPAQEIALEFAMILDFSTGTGTGTFTASGAIEATGTATQQFWSNGHSVHGVKTLTTDVGAITIQFQGAATFTSASTATVVGGFVIKDGGGDYAGIRGAGQLDSQLAFDPSLGAFVITATYTGMAHLGD